MCVGVEIRADEKSFGKMDGYLSKHIDWSETEKLTVIVDSGQAV